MIKSFFKIAFRAIWRNWSSSLINIVGLSIAMASFILIFIWVQDEINFDKHFEKSDRIFLVHR
jgi:putative ABC transport system permease protein